MINFSGSILSLNVFCWCRSSCRMLSVLTIILSIWRTDLFKLLFNTDRSLEKFLLERDGMKARRNNTHDDARKKKII